MNIIPDLLQTQAAIVPILCASSGDVEVYKFVTDPDMDKFVPRSLQQHIAGGKITYTDIIRYDPKLIAHAPYRLPVSSIPPVFSNRVSQILCKIMLGILSQEFPGAPTLPVIH